MPDSSLTQQTLLLENRERILSVIKEYPNVVNVGVGLKETKDEITSTLCYRVYVSEKKDPKALRQDEMIPAIIDGFITDVISYGIIDEIADDGNYRPLKGGIQIKNDHFVNDSKRGMGTLGCLATIRNTKTVVALTNQHVVSYNTEDGSGVNNEIGQPWKVVCCCCCTKNIIGKVKDSKKDKDLDCAILELHDDIVNDIRSHGAINEILEIGSIQGKAKAVAGQNTPVKKRGAATGITRGTIVDVAFDGKQILIAPLDGVPFASFGDSGSIVLNEENHVIGLLWGIKRDRFRNPGQPAIISTNIPDALDPRTHGVATPIDNVEDALDIDIPIPPPVTPSISLHPSDTITLAAPSILSSPAKTQKHFVTVKGDGDVILQVTFLESIDPSRVTWVSDNPFVRVTWPGVGTDNTTVKVSRGTSKGEKANINVAVDGYSVGEKVLVWVVWAATSKFNAEDLVIDVGKDAVKATFGFRVNFKIQPPEIFPVNSTDDVPDLRGPNTIPPPNVPDVDTHVFNKGIDLSKGAAFKWDASVSIKCNLINDSLVFLPNEDFNIPFTQYPSLPVVGNYDPSTDIPEDPYVADGVTQVGEIGISKVIEHSLRHDTQPIGSFGIGAKLTFKIHFRAFARLQLGQNWFVISDDRVGRMHLNYTKRDELAEETDFNHDGDRLDYVWFGQLGGSNSKDCFVDDSDADFDN